MTEEIISCEVFIEFLSDYANGDLPDARKQVFENHMTQCTDCEAYLDSYEKTISLVQRAKTKGDIPDEAPKELIDAILAARSQS